MKDFEVHFIQYIVDAAHAEEHETHSRYLRLKYTVSMDFVPTKGLFVDFETPFREWEFQVEKVIWHPSNEPISLDSFFVCYMTKIFYSNNSVESSWMNVCSYEDLYSFYREVGERINGKSYGRILTVHIDDYDPKYVVPDEDLTHTLLTGEAT